MQEVLETRVQSLGREDPGGGHDNPFQYPCLENPMNRGVWRATVHEITKSRTRLSDLACMLAVDTLILMASMDDHQHSLYWREWGG